jgi:electron transfer flavoprotein alpha subunit
MGAGLVLDCMNVQGGKDGLTVTKPMNGGAVMGQLVIHGSPALVSIRGGVFEPAAMSGSGEIQRIEMRDPDESGQIEFLEAIPLPAAGQRLKDAKKIVSGGRGVGGRQNWHLIQEAAAAAGAEMGCSRPIVDMEWLAPSHQVGLTGTVVAPDLYIAVGISGAVQHLAGISNAKTVVAINSDPDAEIFRRADYGVVGDLKEVLPAFIDRVKEHRK